MSLRINNNIASVNGHRNMVKNDMAVSKSLEKLSSGIRINRAADDAAGLIISEQMRAQLAGLDQATANSEQAVTMVQTAEGALDEMNSVLKKARQLAIHSANSGVNDVNQLAADQKELDNIVSSITRIAENTQFGTKKILDGTLSMGKVTAAGNAAVQSVSINPSNPDALAKGLVDLTVTAAGTKATSTGVSTLAGGAIGTILNGAAAVANISADDTFVQQTTVQLNGVQFTVAAGSTVGAAMSELNTKSGDTGVTATLNSATGAFTLTAVDVGTYANAASLSFTAGATTLTSETVGNDTAGVNAAASLTDSAATAITMSLTTANRGLSLESSALYGISMTLKSGAATTGGVIEVSSGATFQIGANKNQTASVTLASMRATDIGKVGTDNLDSLRSSAFLTNGKANEALDVIDKAIDDVTNTRGALGAFQADTLETTLNSLRVTSENLTAAESTIRDVDYAKESATFTRNNILVQASTAMLAQANQLPQNVLKLLG